MVRLLIAVVAAGCLLTASATPGMAVTRPRVGTSSAIRAARTVRPNKRRARRAGCRSVRRRRRRKLVRVTVCPKPTVHKPKRSTSGTGAGQAKPGPTTTTTTTGGSSAPAAGQSPTTPAPGSASAWDEPVLVDPTTVVLSDSSRSVKLNQSQDYIVECPPGQFDVSGKISIWGGHNVVFQDCDEYVSNPTGDWAGYLEDQTGTLWVHDVHFGGAHLTGGVQVQEPGATVVMRDVLFDTVYGSYQTNHAECVQTWSGPARFLIDGLQCSTTYQGLFLLPNQWDSTTAETAWDFRNVQIDGLGAFDLWLGDVQPSTVGSLPVLNLENVYDCGPGEPRDYDGSSDSGQAWGGVKSCPSGGVSAPVWSTPGGGVTGDDDNATVAAIAGEQP
jgi:hypothetical protein